MKKIRNKLLAGLMFLCSFSLLTGCGKVEYDNPKDAIIDSYGDKQFKISFDSTNLETPISDIFYSARNMPTLPTPVKVGYVFDGWFFDQALSEPCNVDNGDLFWKMSNVTLYAKWQVEQIVNEGQYDIEFEAHIIEDSISKGPLAIKYQRFDEDILDYGTYIEKNDKGTFLRIQYDSRVRGPVLGGDDANEDNFSKQTYTVSTIDNRIDESLSIFDRTSTIQTIYYNIEGLNFSDPIKLYVEYYNWDREIPDKARNQYAVTYYVEFKITRFIGFGASFINTESRLEDGIYTIPTHYCELDKSPSMLDMFNPVNAYIKAEKGRYTLYKPMSAYNNDTPIMEEKDYPLRSTGFAKEFLCFLVDQDITMSKEDAQNLEGRYYIPQMMRAYKYVPVVSEFNSETGQYYYIIDLGKYLTKDVVFLGGSTGFMETFVNLPFDYRRLTLDYKSMIRLTDWPYKERTGDSFTFKERVTLYPGSGLDFRESNTDYDRYQSYRNAIDYKTVFFTKEQEKINLFDSKITIRALDENTPYINEMRNQYMDFEIQYEVFDYDPLIDGKLYSRDLSFVTNGVLRFTNSSEKENIIGKSFNVGDHISVRNIYRELVSNSSIPFEFEAFEVDANLNPNFNKPVKIEDNFDFKDNIALYFKTDYKVLVKNSLVILAKKEKAIIKTQPDWVLDEQTNTFTTKKAFKEGLPVTCPEVQYQYYNNGFTTRGLYKDEENKDKVQTDFTKVSLWTKSQGVLKSLFCFPSPESDFEMPSEKVIALYQLVNQFNEFEVYTFEFTGEASGTYAIKDKEETIAYGDISYENNKRKNINHEHLKTLDIVNQKTLESIPRKYTIQLHTNKIVEEDIIFHSAFIYLKNETVKVSKIEDIWAKIQEEPYAVIYLYYSSASMDQLLTKAQYNLKIQGDEINSYNIISETKTIFTNTSVNFENPIITNASAQNLSYGEMKVLKRTGNNYVANAYDSFSLRTSKYSAELEFREEGEYLINYNFSFHTDQKGNPVFKGTDINDSYNLININLSQKVNVVSQNTDINLTFVTDLAHPFERTSKELVGFTFKTDENFEYATKKFTRNETPKSLSSEAFKETDDLLYKWGDYRNKLIATPDAYMENVHLKVGSINPILYAKFDSGVTLGVYKEIDGVATHVFDSYVRKNNRTGNEYYDVNVGTLAISADPGFEVYGWKASANIFREQIQMNGSMQYIMTNFHRGIIKGFVQLYGPVDFTCIFRRQVAIFYKAYDESGNQLSFLQNLEDNYGVFVGDTLAEAVNENKLAAIKNASCKESISKELIHWRVKNYQTGEYEIIKPNEIEKFKLDLKYAKNRRFITLEAIFR